MNSYLERLRQELEDATGGGSDLGQTPGGKWTPAQILEHLLLTYKNTSKALDKCLQQGTTLARRPTFRDRAATLLVVGIGYLPKGRKAPERAIPVGMAFAEVRDALSAELERMGSGLDACEKKFGSRTKILDHPFIGPLTAEEWRKFHWVHGRHHARQIRERMGGSS